MYSLIYKCYVYSAMRTHQIKYTYYEGIPMSNKIELQKENELLKIENSILRARIKELMDTSVLRN